MPSLVKTSDEILIMRRSAKKAATVLQTLRDSLKEGISTYELDEIAKNKMLELDCRSACLNYPSGDSFFPGHVCISVNEEIVHGIPSLKKIINSGDVVSLDVVIESEGYVTDNAFTMKVGSVSKDIELLLKIGEKSLLEAVKQAKHGNRVGNISNAVESFVRPYGFGIVTEYVGHGVGLSMHEDPQIPNFGSKNSGIKLVSGMTLAIEPMINLKSSKTLLSSDNWTVVAADNSPSVHFEHTVLVTDSGGEILTKI